MKTPQPSYCVRAPAPGEPPEAWQVLAPDGQPVDAAQRLLRSAALRGLQPTTLRTYAYDLLCIYRWQAQNAVDLTALTSNHLLDFIAGQRQIQPSVAVPTLNRRLELLQRLGDILAQRPPSLASRKLRRRRSSQVRLRAEQRLVRPLADHEILAFFESLRTARDRAIVLALWLAGLRAAEVLRLQTHDIDFHTLSLKVFGKGRKERMLPLAEPLAKALLYYVHFERPAHAGSPLFVVLKGPHRGRPLSYAGLHRIFRYHRQLSEILHANPHRFRHAFGASMTRCQVPLAVLASLMGHSNPQTTMRYIQLNDQQVREQYEHAIQILQQDGCLPPPQLDGDR